MAKQELVATTRERSYQSSKKGKGRILARIHDENRPLPQARHQVAESTFQRGRLSQLVRRPTRETNIPESVQSFPRNPDGGDPLMGSNASARCRGSRSGRLEATFLLRTTPVPLSRRNPGDRAGPVCQLLRTEGTNVGFGRPRSAATFHPRS